jgi:hypothetical protein
LHLLLLLPLSELVKNILRKQTCCRRRRSSWNRLLESQRSSSSTSYSRLCKSSDSYGETNRHWHWASESL